jgi:ribonuclease BN (tRNA processing enzyme)
MSTTFEFLTLGVGDAFTERFYHSSFVLMAGDHRLLVDCPEPIRRILREASESSGQSVKLEDIGDVILTHLHADHASAFETICHYKKHFQRALPTLHTSPEILAVLWDQRLRAQMGRTTDVHTGEETDHTLDEYCRACELSYDHDNEVGPYQISVRRTKHPIPTIGLIIRLGDVSLGYSGDTIFDRTHIEWLSGCDRIIHETNRGPHTNMRDLVALPEEIKSKMWLIHYTDDLVVQYAPIECLSQGQVYTVSKVAAGTPK